MCVKENFFPGRQVIDKLRRASVSNVGIQIGFIRFQYFSTLYSLSPPTRPILKIKDSSPAVYFA